MLNSWEEFWYHPRSALGLALLRIILFAWLLYLYFFNFYATQLHLWSYVPEALWNPIPIFSLLKIPKLSPITNMWIEYFWYLLLFLGIIGIFSRWVCVLTAILAVYLFGLRYSVGNIYANNGILPIAMIILAFSRCGDALSVDAWIKRTRGKMLVSTSADYQWPVQLVKVLFVLIFFFSGLNKIIESGMDWIITDNFRNKLLQRLYYNGPFFWRFQGIGFTEWLVQFPWLCKLMALGAVVIQCAAPLALWRGWLGYSVLAALALLQVMIFFTLTENFVAWVPLYLAFVPWERLIHYLALRFSAAETTMHSAN